MGLLGGGGVGTSRVFIAIGLAPPRKAIASSISFSIKSPSNNFFFNKGKPNPLFLPSLK